MAGYTQWKPAPGECPFRYPVDKIMMGAWSGLVQYAIRQNHLRQAFEHDTGLKLFEPAKTPIDALIDAAVGATGDAQSTLIAFVEWVNVTQWGEDEVVAHPLPDGAKQ